MKTLLATIFLVFLLGGLEVMANDQEAPLKIYNASSGTYEVMEPVVKSEEEWQELLSPEAYEVTRMHGTERAFTGDYHDKKKKGVYKCVCCGIDLFDSETKFDSGTGWPSFYQPVAPENIGSKVDKSFFMTRTEVHCPRCGCHLGHVFDDGPAPTHQRYCINSVSLTFEESEHE